MSLKKEVQCSIFEYRKNGNFQFQQNPHKLPIIQFILSEVLAKA